jgi:hypothetical protein
MGFDWQSTARALKKPRAVPIVDLEMTARESALRVSQGESVMQFMRRVLGYGRDLLAAFADTRGASKVRRLTL